MEGARFAAVDVETTGFSAHRGERICEIAIVDFTAERVENRFCTVINPERDIPWRISQVHGIDNRLARKAPTFEQIAGTLAYLLKGRILIAHNAGFDAGFIKAEFERLGVPTEIPRICTLKSSRKLLHGLPNMQLATVSRHLGHPPFAKHTALADADACAKVMISLVERFPHLRDELDHYARTSGGVTFGTSPRHLGRARPRRR